MYIDTASISLNVIQSGEADDKEHARNTLYASNVSANRMRPWVLDVHTVLKAIQSHDNSSVCKGKNHLPIPQPALSRCLVALPLCLQLVANTGITAI